jgi:hypothetical protein
MRRLLRRGRNALLLGALAVTAPLALPIATVAMAESAQAQTLPSQQNNEGQVTVEVTPLTLSPTAETWRFEVQFNTHVTALDQDLLRVASLSGDSDKAELPSAWEGDPPGGHHRKGVLVFKPIAPIPASVTLSVRGVGPVPERRFTWKLAAP